VNLNSSRCADGHSRDRTTDRPRDNESNFETALGYKARLRETRGNRLYPPRAAVVRDAEGGPEGDVVSTKR